MYAKECLDDSLMLEDPVQSGLLFSRLNPKPFKRKLDKAKQAMKDALTLTLLLNVDMMSLNACIPALVSLK